MSIRVAKAAFVSAVVALAWGACTAGDSFTQAEFSGTRGGVADANANAPAGDSNGVATPVAAVDPRSLCKRGVASALQNGTSLSPNDMAALSANVTWWYNWSPTPDSAATFAAAVEDDVDFVPMVFTAPFDSNAIIAGITSRTRYLLGYNEPNFAAQGNLTPAQAAQYWPQVQAIADTYGLKIVGPAVNYCGDGCNETDPMVWLDAFFAACPNCRVDYIAIHAYVCYGSALSNTYLQPFEAKYTQPIWLTEFACLDGSADASQLSVQENFMGQAVSELEADPRVFRYAWFLARSGSASPPLSLLDTDGTLTALGHYYLSLPQKCASGP